MRHLVTVFSLLLVAACASAPAFARPHHHSHHHVVHSYHHTPHYRAARPQPSSFVHDRQATDVAPRPVERTETTSPGHRWVSPGQTRPSDVRPARSTVVASGGTDRPRDCYGIQWCGCWLRHQFGLASTSLNLAINWARMGNPASPNEANVVVWRHHVGKLLQFDGSRILVQSGNDGNAVRTRWLSPRVLGGVVAYRRV